MVLPLGGDFGKEVGRGGGDETRRGGVCCHGVQVSHSKVLGGFILDMNCKKKWGGFKEMSGLMLRGEQAFWKKREERSSRGGGKRALTDAGAAT